MTREQLAEESNIDIAYAVLAETGESLTLRQLMDEVRKLNGVTVRAMANSLNRVNTDINIDFFIIICCFKIFFIDRFLKSLKLSFQVQMLREFSTHLP